MATSLYIHKPLKQPGSQIRLLTLMPTCDMSSIIETCLSQHSFPRSNASRGSRLCSHVQLPSYFALSYVWGSTERSNEILVNGKRFPVTSNLYFAMHDLRSSVSWPLLLWVDSICINQDDDGEKSNQIPIMREIYHIAVFVIVSLGEPNPNNDKIMRFVNKLTFDPRLNKAVDMFLNLRSPTSARQDGGLQAISRARSIRAIAIEKFYAWLILGILWAYKPLRILLDVCRNKLKDDQEYEEPISEQINRPRFNRRNREQVLNVRLERVRMGYIKRLEAWRPTQRCVQAVDPKEFSEIAQLIEESFTLTTQYFNRMWTLQEAVVGNMVSVANGGLLINLPDIVRIIYYLRSTGKISMSTINMMTTLWTINSTWRSGLRLRLQDLLFFCGTRKCFDPKDKVYALVGLTHDRMNLYLQPNYRLSMREIYANTTRYIVSSEHSLEILCGGRTSTKPAELPSWTADFRYFGQKGAAPRLVDLNGLENIYKASGSEMHINLSVQMATSSRWDILYVKGVHIGTVQTISQCEENREGFDQIQRRWNTALTQSKHRTWTDLKELGKLSYLLTLYNSFYQAADEAADRTAFWSQNENAATQIKKLTEDWLEHGNDTHEVQMSYLITLLCGRITSHTRCTPSDLMELLRRASIRNSVGDAALLTLCRGLEAGMRQRRLVITKEGSIGAATQEAQKGDEVCVLMGCSVPVILRKLRDCAEWMFVGECYLHGYTDEEAIKDLEGVKLVPIIFALI
jgi:hypothetical protein